MAYYYLSGSNSNSCGYKKTTSCCAGNRKQQEWLLNRLVASSIHSILIKIHFDFFTIPNSFQLHHFQIHFDFSRFRVSTFSQYSFFHDTQSFSFHNSHSSFALLGFHSFPFPLSLLRSTFSLYFIHFPLSTFIYIHPHSFASHFSWPSFAFAGPVLTRCTACT